MSLASYTDLTAAVGNYMARSDLTAFIPDFVTQTEAMMNRMVRTPDMEASTSPTLTSGTASLPSDFLEWISLTWTNGTRTIDLRFVEADSEEWRIRYRPSLDPQQFAIIADKISIRPVVTGTITFNYYQQIPALITNNTNWMMTKHPDIYLSLSLFFANVFVMNDERAQELFGLAQDQMNKADLLSDSAKLALRGNPAVVERDELGQARNIQAGAV